MPNRDQLTANLLMLFLWGLAGGLFGAVFVGLYLLFILQGFVDWQPLVFAAAVAAMTTSAFYSAMPVALLGAMGGVLASIGHLIVSGHDLDMGVNLVVALIVGVIAGGVFAWVGRGKDCSLTETLNGLLSGLLGSGCLVLLSTLLLDDRHWSTFVMSAGIVALVGSIFQIVQRWLVAHKAVFLPAMFSAPLVCGLIAVVVASSIGLLSGSHATAFGSDSGGSISFILSRLPLGFWGGLIGGLISGFLLELVGFHLEERS